MTEEISTEALTLVPGSRRWIHTCITRPDRLARHLGVSLAHDWNQAFYNQGAPWVLEFMHESDLGWWYWWLIERPGIERARPSLVGVAGFKGPPTAGGNVELLYNVAASSRRRGLASQSVQLLLDWAFRNPKVRRAIATIDPANLASQAVVRKCGFSLVEGDCDEEEVVYAIGRDQARLSPELLTYPRLQAHEAYKFL